MKWPTISMLLVRALVLLVPAGVRAADIIALCESFPPYSYEDQGVQKGMTVDVLRETCEKAGLTCDIRFMPSWARAYHETLANPGTLLFTTVRTPERESSFSWVGPIAYREAWLFSLADSAVRIERAEDIGSYRVGVVSSEATYQELLGLGVPQSSFDISTSNETLIRKLLHHRVDVMANTANGMATLLDREGASADQVRKIFLLNRAGYYFALNPNTDPTLAQRLSKALAEVTASGYVKDAIARYNLSDTQP